jgi:hypothetical protein
MLVLMRSSWTCQQDNKPHQLHPHLLLSDLLSTPLPLLVLEKLFALTVSDRFGPAVGWNLIKPSAINANFLGRPSGSTHSNMRRLCIARSTLAPL